MKKNKRSETSGQPADPANPGNTGSVLRVHFSRRAYADLVAHAKESLDAEVCGVLVGQVSQDPVGSDVEARAIIRGDAAREARAHVTFTHETWNRIHTALDKDFPELQIVGWYHTHPGFGVEFSAMDRFIQQNFFSAKTQVGFLTDPLGGDVSLCFNGDSEIEYLSRFWVDGREHIAKTPADATHQEGSASAGGTNDLRHEIERLESRINQLIVASDEQRRNFHRTLTTSVMAICGILLLFVSYQIYLAKVDRLRPPAGTGNYLQVPVKVGDQTVMVGLEVVQWQVPPSMNAMMDKLARAEIEQKLAEKSGEPAVRPWYIRLLESVGLRNPPPLPPAKEQSK